VSTNDAGDLGILGRELHRRVDHQTADAPVWCHQIRDQPVEIGAQLRERRPREVERAHLLRHDESGIAVERAQEELTLPTLEGVVEAARPNTGRRDEIVDRGVVVAPIPELAHGTLENLIGIELSRPSHGATLSERSLKNSYESLNRRGASLSVLRRSPACRARLPRP
jgi:hypothetical protein